MDWALLLRSLDNCVLQFLNLLQNLEAQLSVRPYQPHRLIVVTPLEECLPLEVDVLVATSAKQCAQQLVRDVDVKLGEGKRGIGGKDCRKVSLLFTSKSVPNLMLLCKVSSQSMR